MTSDRWEYEVLKLEPGGVLGGKVDVDELKSYLNQLGQQGWELANSFETNILRGRSREVILILKRPIG
jgi:hypothetical protein